MWGGSAMRRSNLPEFHGLNVPSGLSLRPNLAHFYVLCPLYHDITSPNIPLTEVRALHQTVRDIHRVGATTNVQNKLAPCCELLQPEIPLPDVCPFSTKSMAHLYRLANTADPNKTNQKEKQQLPAQLRLISSWEIHSFEQSFLRCKQMSLLVWNCFLWAIVIKIRRHMHCSMQIKNLK